MTGSCDVLVVGGGGAGLRAAIAAAEAAPDLRVILVTKGALGRSGVTATACSDRMAFHATLPTTAPGGDGAWRFHADDIYRIGGCVSDADLAVVLARESAGAFAYLDSLGVPWARRDDGAPDQFLTDGSIYPRACYTGPYTANDIEAALLRRARTLPIDVIDHHLVAELLLDDRGAVAGAALVSEGGDVTALGARAVVLATGGAGHCFEVNVFPADCTGDGYALAYRAGAELVNLEFIQIGLCSTATGLACSGSMMRAVPRVVNDRGEEFLPRYFAAGTEPMEIHTTLFSKGASWPVSIRDRSHRIDIAVAAEIAAGRRVYLDYGRDPLAFDLARLPGEARRRLAAEGRGLTLGDEAAGTPLGRLRAINAPSVTWLAERGVDLAGGEALEIAPAVQHCQGGVKIRTRGETTVAGLYAAGETAGGQHGANRPGGNALLDAQVFGRLAGVAAAEHARSRGGGQAPSDAAAGVAVGALFDPSGEDPTTVRGAVQRAMSRACGVLRTAEGLRRALGELEGLAARGVRSDGARLVAAVEALNLLQTARLVATAALARDESRGPHLRFPSSASLMPLPQDDARWQRQIVLYRGKQGIACDVRVPVRPSGGE